MSKQEVTDIAYHPPVRHSVEVGPNLTVTFQRTLRIRDDPLPPGLGAFPLFRVKDFPGRVPPHWLEESGGFIPMYQREALRLSFECPSWRALAVKVGVGDERDLWKALRWFIAAPPPPP